MVTNIVVIVCGTEGKYTDLNIHIMAENKLRGWFFVCLFFAFCYTKSVNSKNLLEYLSLSCHIYFVFSAENGK